MNISKLTIKPKMAEILITVRMPKMFKARMVLTVLCLKLAALISGLGLEIETKRKDSSQETH